MNLENRPFWFAGIFQAVGLGPFHIHAFTANEQELEKNKQAFQKAAAGLSAEGGGLLSTMVHPYEFVSTIDWDIVNFSNGARPEPEEWKIPERLTKDEVEGRFRRLHSYLEFARGAPDVRFVTLRQLVQLYRPLTPPPLSRADAAAHLARKIDFLNDERGSWSAADMLLALLGEQPRYVDRPTMRKSTNCAGNTIRRAALERAKADAVSYIRNYGRLPSCVWLDAWRLSLGDFTATLAGDGGVSREIPVRMGNLDSERYTTSDPVKPWEWPVDPQGTDMSNLVEVAKLQAWTIKPAKLK